MFRGQYEHAIDAKGRLSIPARFREVLLRNSPNRVVVTNFDKYLLAYPLPEFEAIAEKLSHQPQTEKVRMYTRMFVGGAHELDLDAQGRILLPPTLRKFGALERDVVLVGATKKFEIWAAERWAEESEKAAQLLAGDRDFVPEI